MKLFIAFFISSIVFFIFRIFNLLGFFNFYFFFDLLLLMYCFLEFIDLSVFPLAELARITQRPPFLLVITGILLWVFFVCGITFPYFFVFPVDCVDVSMFEDKVTFSSLFRQASARKDWRCIKLPIRWNFGVLRRTVS